MIEGGISSGLGKSNSFNQEFEYSVWSPETKSKMELGHVMAGT